MSLVTSLPLLVYWRAAQLAVDSEWQSRSFWVNLLSRHMFPEAEYHVVQEEPPSSASGRRRIDILVERVDAKTEDFQILCFVECKRPNASASLIKEVEDQAFNACVSYLAEKRLEFVYAMTTIGTRARLWVYQPPNDFLYPFWGSQDPSAIQYIEAHSADAERLRAGFNQMKPEPPPTTGSHPVQQNLEAPQMNQPLAGPSLDEAFENLVVLRQILDIHGNSCYSWKMPDGQVFTEWVDSSKWMKIELVPGVSYFRHPEMGVWSADLD